MPRRLALVSSFSSWLEVKKKQIAPEGHWEVLLGLWIVYDLLIHHCHPTLPANMIQAGISLYFSRSLPAAHPTSVHGAGGGAVRKKVLRMKVVLLWEDSCFSLTFIPCRTGKSWLLSCFGTHSCFQKVEMVWLVWLFYHDLFATHAPVSI